MYLKYVRGGSTANDTIPSEDRRAWKFIQVQLLVDKLGDLQSANSAMDDFICRNYECERIPNMIAIHFVLDNTVDSSPLRRLLVDYYIHGLAIQRVVEEDSAKAPRAFLEAVIKEYSRLEKEHPDI